MMSSLRAIEQADFTHFGPPWSTNQRPKPIGLSVCRRPGYAWRSDFHKGMLYFLFPCKGHFSKNTHTHFQLDVPGDVAQNAVRLDPRIAKRQQLGHKNPQLLVSSKRCCAPPFQGQEQTSPSPFQGSTACTPRLPQ